MRFRCSARIAAAEAAIARLDELAGEDWVREETHRRMRGLYDFRIRRFEARLDEAVREGHVPQERADRVLQAFDEHFDDLARRSLPSFG